MNFISILAQGQAPGGGIGGIFGSLPVMLIVMFVIIYFLMIRPQQKRVKEHQALVSQVTRGDKVVMTGGLHGTVYEVNDKTVLVEVWKNTVLTYDKASIQTVLRDSPAETAAKG